jgi:hypothetical protein
MLATVHVLHPQPSVGRGFLRVGHTGHRRAKAEELEHGSIFLASIDISPKNNSTSCSR